MTARCMKCKTNTADVEASVKTAKNGAKMQHSTCGVCGTKKCQIGGSAFTDFFTKTIPTALKKPSTYLKLGSFIPYVGPAMGVAGTIASMTGNGARRKRAKIGGSTYYPNGKLKTGFNPDVLL